MEPQRRNGPWNSHADMNNEFVGPRGGRGYQRGSNRYIDNEGGGRQNSGRGWYNRRSVGHSGAFRSRYKRAYEGYGDSYCFEYSNQGDINVHADEESLKNKVNHDPGLSTIMNSCEMATGSRDASCDNVELHGEIVGNVTPDITFSKKCFPSDKSYTSVTGTETNSSGNIKVQSSSQNHPHYEPSDASKIVHIQQNKGNLVKRSEINEEQIDGIKISELTPQQVDMIGGPDMKNYDQEDSKVIAAAMTKIEPDDHIKTTNSAGQHSKNSLDVSAANAEASVIPPLDTECSREGTTIEKLSDAEKFKEETGRKNKRQRRRQGRKTVAEVVDLDEGREPVVRVKFPDENEEEVFTEQEIKKEKVVSEIIPQYKNPPAGAWGQGSVNLIKSLQSSHARVTSIPRVQTQARLNFHSEEIKRQSQRQGRKTMPEVVDLNEGSEAVARVSSPDEDAEQSIKEEVISEIIPQYKNPPSGAWGQGSANLIKSLQCSQPRVTSIPSMQTQPRLNFHPEETSRKNKRQRRRQGRKTVTAKVDLDEGREAVVRAKTPDEDEEEVFKEEEIIKEEVISEIIPQYKNPPAGAWVQGSVNLINSLQSSQPRVTSIPSMQTQSRLNIHPEKTNGKEKRQRRRQGRKTVTAEVDLDEGKEAVVRPKSPDEDEEEVLREEEIKKEEVISEIIPQYKNPPAGAWGQGSVNLIKSLQSSNARAPSIPSVQTQCHMNFHPKEIRRENKRQRRRQGRKTVTAEVDLDEGKEAEVRAKSSDEDEEEVFKEEVISEIIPQYKNPPAGAWGLGSVNLIKILQSSETRVTKIPVQMQSNLNVYTAEPGPARSSSVSRAPAPLPKGTANPAVVEDIPVLASVLQTFEQCPASTSCEKSEIMMKDALKTKGTESLNYASVLKGVQLPGTNIQKEQNNETNTEASKFMEDASAAEDSKEPEPDNQVQNLSASPIFIRNGRSYQDKAVGTHGV